MLSVAKLATPLTAATVFVPAKVPPLGLVPPSATVTWPVKVGTVFPEASWAVTSTAGAMAGPAVAFPGGTAGAVGPRSHVARNSEDTRRAAPRSSRASKAEEGERMVVAIGQCSWTYISLPRLGLRNSHWGLGERLNACVGRKGCAPRTA